MDTSLIYWFAEERDDKTLHNGPAMINCSSQQVRLLHIEASILQSDHLSSNYYHHNILNLI